MSRIERRIVTSHEAPKAVGPYSHAVAVGDLVFTSGQIPLDPATGTLVPGGIDVQTKRVMENLSLVLAAAGTSLSRVVKSTIYLVDLGDFAAVNAIYGTYFQSEPPARSTVQVAALPLGAAVEIDMIAHVG